MVTLKIRKTKLMSELKIKIKIKKNLVTFSGIEIVLCKP